VITSTSLEMYRQRLEALAERFGRKLSDLRHESAHGLGGESGGGISNVPTHQADLGSAHHEEEVGLLLVENEEQLLVECEGALARIHAGTFGICESCSKEIPAGRLETFPYARYCVDCASRLEPQTGS